MNSTPLRRCTGCFQEFPQRELIRVVKTNKGQFLVEFPQKSQKTPGRGAYLCANEACLQKALKQKGRKCCPLQFWLGIAIPETIVKELQQLTLKKDS